MHSQFQAPEMIENLFPEKLISTLCHPHPEAEKNLKNYVSYLLSIHSYRDLKMGIVLRAASISPLNNKVNYWIIKTAFKNKKSFADFRQFLVLLVHAIPQSSFLWFYFQKSLNSLLNESDWDLLFKIYCPENMEKVFTGIKSGMASAYLSENSTHTSVVNDACIYYATGNFIKAAEICTKVKTESKFNPVDKHSLDMAIDILTSCLIKFNKQLAQQIFTKPEHAKGQRAVMAFESGDHEQAITLFNEILTNETEFKHYSDQEIGHLCYFASISYEAKEDYTQALHLIEASYPDTYLSSNGDDTLAKLLAESIVRLVGKLSKNAAALRPHINGLYYPDAQSLYDLGLHNYENQNSTIAIKLINAAFATFASKNVINVDCVKCYSSIGTICQDLGLIPAAIKKYQMAYVLAIQVYEPDSPVLISIEKDLRLAEVKLAIKKDGTNSISCAMAYRTLGIFYEKTGDLAGARIAYKVGLDLFKKVHGENHVDTQEIMIKLEAATNIMTKPRLGKK